MSMFPEAAGAPPFRMLEMIRGQPAFVRETGRRATRRAVGELLGPARDVVITGCGTSFHAALYGARALRTLASHMRVDAIHASDLYDSPPGRTVTVVAVSHSGATPMTNRAVRRARRAGARVVGICGRSGSSMERLTDATLVIGSVRDRSWANTMSYTTQLAAFGQVAARLADRGGEAVAESLRSLPGALERALRSEPHVRRLARSVAARDRVTFLGSGLNEITALEAALKIRETCSLPASGYHIEQFLHGPFLSLDRRERVVALVSLGNARRQREILDALARTGASVTTVGTSRRADIAVPRVHPILQPIVDIVPMQLLAYHAAVARGVNPDVMRTDVRRYRPGVALLFR